MISYGDARVVITGASGFLGSHTARALIARGARVHAFVRPSASLDRLADIQSQITIHAGDVTDLESIRTCFRDADPQFVFHLAGDVSARRSQGGSDAAVRSVDVNLVGTINVVRAAAETATHVESFIRSGGIEEYGRAALPYVEGVREEPVSAYSAAQVGATHFCQAIQPELQFQLVTVRPSLIYGPGQSTSFFIPQLVASCLAGTDFDMTDGKQSRDFLYVDDAIEGILLAGSKDNLRGAIINLASGEEHSIGSIAEKILKLTGASIALRRGAKAASEADLQRLVSSPALAKNLLGWSPRTSIDEGLRLTIASMRSRVAPR